MLIHLLVLILAADINHTFLNHAEVYEFFTYANYFIVWEKQLRLNVAYEVISKFTTCFPGVFVVLEHVGEVAQKWFEESLYKPLSGLWFHLMIKIRLPNKVMIDEVACQCIFFDTIVHLLGKVLWSTLFQLAKPLLDFFIPLINDLL